MPGRQRTGSTGLQPDELVVDLSRRLADVERLKNEGQLAAARRECEGLLHEAPDYVGALLVHGLICLSLKDFERAYRSLSRANDLYPDDYLTLIALARAKAHLAMRQSAIHDLEAALSLAPGNLAALNTLSEIYQLSGEGEKAERVLREIISQNLHDPESKVRLARCLITLGKGAESRALLKGLINVGYLSPQLLQTLSFFPEDPDLVDIVSATDHISGRSRDEEASILSMRATGMHWAGRHEEAWDLYCKSNAIRWEQQGARWGARRGLRQDYLRKNERIPVQSSVRAAVANAPCPLFVLGASQSGKSTVERLLGAVPSVACGYENDITNDVLHRVMDGARCANVAGLIDMPSELGAIYAEKFAGALRKRAPEADVFVMASPEPIGNALTLNKYVPASRFVLLKRGRRDHAFRIFTWDYHDAAIEMSCSGKLDAVVEYLDWYDRMIEICAERMPGQCLVLTYEEVVQDPAAAVAEILNLCGKGDGGARAQLPVIGDDRGVAAPYARWLDRHLGQ